MRSADSGLKMSQLRTKQKPEGKSRSGEFPSMEETNFFDPKSLGHAGRARLLAAAAQGGSARDGVQKRVGTGATDTEEEVPALQRHRA